VHAETAEAVTSTATPNVAADATVIFVAIVADVKKQKAKSGGGAPRRNCYGEGGCAV
jgi:hypothetical protein